MGSTRSGSHFEWLQSLIYTGNAPGNVDPEGVVFIVCPDARTCMLNVMTRYSHITQSAWTFIFVPLHAEGRAVSLKNGRTPISVLRFSVSEGLTQAESQS